MWLFAGLGQTTCGKQWVLATYFARPVSVFVAFDAEGSDRADREVAD